MCPAGYELQDVSNQIDNTVFECKCQQHVPQIVLCENDQKTIVIKVHIKTLKYNPRNNYNIFRAVNGLCMFLVDLSLIWCFITVQWATVDVVMIPVWAKTLVYTPTLILILTCNVTVIEKVSPYHNYYESMRDHTTFCNTVYIYTGIVCGKCRNENKGASALFNHCTTCSNAAALLIVALS